MSSDRDRGLPGYEGVLGGPIIRPEMPDTSPTDDLSKLTVIEGKLIMAPDGDGKLVDSTTLIGKGKNNNWAQKQLWKLPLDAGVYNNLGCAYAWLSEWDAAEEMFTKALSVQAAEPEAKAAATDNLALVKKVRPRG